MPIATGLAIGLAAASIGGSLGGAAIASHGATSAANAQVSAANYAAQLQHEDAQQALAFQQQQYATQQQQMAPWLHTGTAALGNLSYLMGLSPQQAQGQLPPQGTTVPLSSLQGGQAGGVTPAGVGAIGPAPLVDQAKIGTGGEPPNIQGAPPEVGLGMDDTTGGATPTGAPPTGLPTGTGGTMPLSSLGGFGSLAQPWTDKFTAPTDVTEQNDPGYKFRLQQGMQALQNSAAARGGLLSSGTAKNINDYAQNYASNEYQNVYGRALGEYQQGYNIFQNNQANLFNRLSALSGTGQTAAGQLASSGQSAANNISNILLTSGAQQGQAAQNAGAARASGYAASGNLYGNALSGGTSNLTQLLLLRSLLGTGGSTVYGGGAG